MDVTVTFAVLVALISAADPLKENYGDPEEELIKHLLDNGYDRRARPGVIVNGTKSQVSVSVVFAPYQIIAVDDRLETMTVLLGIQQRWHDPRLVWTPETFGNLTAVTFEVDKIWTPRGLVSNILVMNREDKTDSQSVEAFMSPVQEIFSGSYSLAQERCALDMTYFPFDRQTCRLCLYSIQHRIKDLIYTPVSGDQSTYQQGGEWFIENMKAESLNFSNFSAACVSLTVQRKSLFHVINLFLPTIIICVLNTVGLFASIDAEHGEMDYGALGQTTLLSLSVLLLTVAEETPKGAATVSLLGIFFLAMIFQTLLATVMAMYMKKFHRRYEKAQGSSSSAKRGSYIGMHAGTICMALHLAVITFMTAAVFGIGFWNKMGKALSG